MVLVIFALFVLLGVLAAGQAYGPSQGMLLSFTGDILLFVSITVAHEVVGRYHRCWLHITEKKKLFKFDL